MAQVATLLWVCTDCAFMLANGEAEGTTPEWQDAHAAGIERVLDGHYGSVVAGGEHHCGEPGEQDCDCEDGGFSHYECELCRSSLAGYRFAATVLYA